MCPRCFTVVKYIATRRLQTTSVAFSVGVLRETSILKFVISVQHRALSRAHFFKILSRQGLRSKTAVVPVSFAGHSSKDHRKTARRVAAAIRTPGGT